jgi:Fe-S cluster biogenesis protein NfuA
MSLQTAEATPTIAAQPLDAERCRFVVGTPIAPDRWAYFAGREDSSDSSLAARLFEVDGVRAVLISHDKLTITRARPESKTGLGRALTGIRRLFGDPAATPEAWADTARAVGLVVREHLALGAEAVSDSAYARMPSTAELRRRVQRVLDEEVNPVVASHGGGVALHDVIDNVVYVRMSGGCQGCGLADNTLKHGVEGSIRESVPEIGEIIDLTDHSSGTNPFRAGPKSSSASPFSPREKVPRRGG